MNINDFPFGFAPGSDEAKNHGMTCKKCRWRPDEFTSVCVNPDSPKCADFVREDDGCEWWEQKKKEGNKSD